MNKTHKSHFHFSDQKPKKAITFPFYILVQLLGTSSFTVGLKKNHKDPENTEREREREREREKLLGVEIEQRE